MNIANEVATIRLQDLLGPTASITDVDCVEGFIHFNLPLHPEQRFEPVNCQICGVYEGKLECLISEEELDSQLALRTALITYAKNYFKNEQP